MKRLLCICLICFILLCGGCGKGDNVISRTGIAMDTDVTIKLYGTSDERILDDCFALLMRYEKLFSRTDTSSELYSLNENGGGKASDELFELISLSLEFAELTNGAFDPTVGALTRLWDFTSGEAVLPANNKIADALACVSYKDVSLGENSVTYKKEGMYIDLGGIAKGYAADKLRELVISRGVNSAIIALGGNIVCVGAKGKEPFRVGIQRPFSDSGDVIRTLELNDTSAVTSGSYQRYFKLDGRIYHHILDPRTGYPAKSGLLSVTVCADSSAMCDALSTAFFVMGEEEAVKLNKTLDGVKVYIVREGENEAFELK